VRPQEDSQITSVRKEDSQITAVQSPEDAHTHVEIPAPQVSARIARGKNQHGTGNAEVGEHTDVIDTKAHETLTDFSTSGDLNSNVGDLVCYDDEVAGPFEGMLISNRYRLQAQIGTGAFGVVFDAFDKETETRVAIKLLSPTLSEDKRALARFRREAIAASRIQHPGIVAIHDFGIQDEGISYIVMEYLAGRDLATLLEEEPYISAQRAAGIIQQCAQALASAHEEGVLHRDLKPANIFLVQNPDRSERIKILDFGIAKDRSSNPRTADLTSASKVVGTPYYMAPEQAQGKQLDARADVYSLGVILFELLTGRRPFEGASVYEILLAHVGAERVPPSSIRPELAREQELESIVLKAIDSSAKNRFASMKEFSAALRAYQRASAERAHNFGPHHSLHDLPAPITETGQDFFLGPAVPPKRPKRAVIAWAAVPLALAVGALVLLRSNDATPTSASPSEAVVDSAPAAAPKTTAPETTAPKTTAPKTSAPETTAPISAKPVVPNDEPALRSDAPVVEIDDPPSSRSTSGKRRKNDKKKSSKKRRPKGIEEW
jgi:serine/threonine-protein kinase